MTLKAILLLLKTLGVPTVDTLPAACTQADNLDGVHTLTCGGRRTLRWDELGTWRVYRPNGEIVTEIGGKVVVL